MTNQLQSTAFAVLYNFDADSFYESVFFTNLYTNKFMFMSEDEQTHENPLNDVDKCAIICL